eukprot:1449172-Pyramimonas_sp.AAC.1
MPTITYCGAMRRTNLRLKLCSRRGLSDHVPTLVKFQYEFDLSSARKATTRWDFDRLASALRKGVGVADFLADVEAQFGAAPDYHTLLLHASAPDDAWQEWITTIYAAAE